MRGCALRRVVRNLAHKNWKTGESNPSTSHRVPRETQGRRVKKLPLWERAGLTAFQLASLFWLRKKKTEVLICPRPGSPHLFPIPPPFPTPRYFPHPPQGPPPHLHPQSEFPPPPSPLRLCPVSALPRLQAETHDHSGLYYTRHIPHI